MSFNFQSLNLSGVDVSSGGSLLKPGEYIAKVTEAKVIDTSDKSGKRLEVKFSDVNGAGTISYYMNIYLPGKTEATNIGRGELKTLLYYGGHPNYNAPGDVTSIKGLTVGIRVVEDTYVSKGITKTTSQVKSVFDPAKLDPTNFVAKPVPKKEAANGTFSTMAATGTGGMNDEIPF